MTTTTAPTSTPRRVRHKKLCSQPDPVSTYVLEARRLTCPECSRHLTLATREESPFWDPTTPAYVPPVDVAPPPPPAHGYACRAHYRPTNWRGHGCPQCDSERRTARRARAQKRAARLTEPTE